MCFDNCLSPSSMRLLSVCPEELIVIRRLILLSNWLLWFSLARTRFWACRFCRYLHSCLSLGGNDGVDHVCRQGERPASPTKSEGEKVSNGGCSEWKANGRQPRFFSWVDQGFSRQSLRVWICTWGLNDCKSARFLQNHNLTSTAMGNTTPLSQEEFNTRKFVMAHLGSWIT
jgi:hypothetical protein